MAHLQIAVVILNWNGKALLEQFIPSIVSYSKNATIYVADNASTDDSIAFLETNFPAIKILKNTANYGFARGYNEALKEVDADIFALVNSDVEVTDGWLDPIKSTFEKEANVSIIQPKILDYKNKQYFEYAGAAGGFIDKFGYPYCRGRIFNEVEQDVNQYDNNCPIFWASGACLFIRSSLFKTLGGFDCDFFAHQEEIDLCWRAFNLGYKTQYVAQSVIYHVGGATLAMGSTRKTELNFRNSLLMLHKNLPAKNRYWIIFQRLFLDGIAGVHFLIQLKPMHCLAIIRAHFEFYKMVSKNNMKRGLSQRDDYYAVKSIIWQYFIEKKNTFSKLF